MNEVMVDDKTAMRRLGTAILMMCGGAIGLIVLAMTVGNLH